MIFTTPLGLLALLAIPAIVGIHLFRQRFPRRTVAGLFLWQISRQVPQGGGRIARLPITLSLILECLAALALALILAGARLRPEGLSAHLVVLLDDSASMSAINGQNESPRDRGTARILSEVERLGSTSRVTLVLSGERPSILLGPSAISAEAREALDRWKPAATRHSLALGLRLAREVAGKTGRLMIISDTLPKSRGEEEPAGALWVAAGEPLGNTGILGAERTRARPGDPEVVALTLGNFSKDKVRRRLRVISGNQEVLARDVDTPAGTSSLNLPLPAGTGPVRVTLSDDALARDNEVTLVEQQPRLVLVENRLPDGRGKQALAKALKAISGVSLAEQGHLAFQPAADLDKPAAPGVWRAAFGNPPATMRASGEPRDFLGPFVPEKQHPLLEGVALAGVVWTGAAPVGAAAYPLVSAGDQPLIALMGGRNGRPEDGILFDLDLERTNLIRAPDWPILVSNLVEWRRANLPGPERWNYRIGEWVRIRLGRDPKGPLRFRIGAIERNLTSGRVIEFIAPGTGGLLEVLEGSDVIYALGVNFLDDQQSNLSSKTRGEMGRFNAAAENQRAESGPASDPLFWALVAVAGAALVANWFHAGSARRVEGRA
jgi:hypothetical protein